MKLSEDKFFSIKNGFFRVIIFTLILLLIPLVAMQFTNEVNWEISDFIAMGLLLFTMGSLFVLAVRKAPRKRVLIGVIFIALFLFIWAELAVGIFTNFST